MSVIEQHDILHRSSDMSLPASPNSGDKRVSQLMEQACIKTEESLVSTFRASASSCFSRNPVEDVSLQQRAARCSADTELLLKAASAYLNESGENPELTTKSSVSSGGVRLQQAKAVSAKARAESLAAHTRVERLLDNRTTRHVVSLIHQLHSLKRSAPSNPSPDHRNCVVVSLDDKDALAHTLADSGISDVQHRRVRE